MEGVLHEWTEGACDLESQVPDGLSPQGLRAVADEIETDLASGLYSGAVLLVSRSGQVPWVLAAGEERPGGAPLRPDAVFNLYSISKAFTNALLFRCLERGELALTTPIVELIPEFSGYARERIDIRHLLTHTAGLLPVFAPRAGMYIDRLDEVIAAICEVVRPMRPPGGSVWYSFMVAHALLGEIIRRCDRRGRTFREIARDDLFAPLKMTDTSFGLRSDLRERYVAPAFGPTSPPMEYLGHGNLGRYGALQEERAEMPWIGAVSTASDLFRFAEMLRLGGALDGERVMSAALLARAREPQTGDLPHEIYRAHCLKRGWKPWPASFGLGFHLRGTAPGHYYHAGSDAPATTFFHVGIGSSVFWIDPVHDVTCVCLTTPVLDEAESIERFERLSDLVHAAVL
jgi:CubicO group peptidase (beta-lactamase class C family)